jgi:site-specific DNA-methyltransferase (adenine-specific)
MPCSLSSLLDSVVLGDNCETLAGMPAECVDLVVTSPPYDDLRTYGGNSWDFERLAGELTRVLKPGGVIVWVVADATINGSETLTSMRQAIHFKDVCGLNAHDTMIYASDRPPLNSNRYEHAFEYMFVFAKGKPKAVNKIKTRSLHGGKQNASRRYYRPNGEVKEMSKPGLYNEEKVLPNIWWYSTGQEKNGHPAVYPIALAKDHVASWSNPGDVVLDPFAGSGTTLKAAKELGRRFVGIEINPEYVEICHRRLAQDVLNLFPENVQAHPRPESKADEK